MNGAAFLALLLVMAACQPAASTLTPPTPAATATGSQPEATPPNGPAEASGPPAGLPVVPGATSQAPPADEPGIIAAWTSPDRGPAVYDFFVAALPAAGFPITELLPGGAVAVIRFASREGDARELLITGAAGETRILLRRCGQEP